MKAKLQETPPYVPSGKIRLTITERKNGFDESRLESYLREACGTEFSFYMERLNRAKWRHKECADLVSASRRFEDLSDPRSMKTLARLEKDAADAAADVQFAEGLLDVASEEAA